MGSIKDMGNFWITKKSQGYFWVMYFLSAQINNNEILLVWDFLGYAKNVGNFLGRQILKLGFFWVQNMNLCQTPVIKISEWGLQGHSQDFPLGGGQTDIF